jgi:SAM-dependent methyltransferase
MHRGLDYARIFDARGQSYHEAMLRFPRARDEEFQLVVQALTARPGLRVADIPSGGGYLKEYVPAGVHYTAVETSEAFYLAASERASGALRAQSLRDLGLPSGSFDAIISLAGLHHEKERRGIYKEFCRTLAPGGQLLIAEVPEGSAVGHFLNGFVDAHGEGHEGWFFDAGERKLIEDAGFSVRTFERRKLRWRAKTELELAVFCQLMFGMTRAKESEIRDVLKRDLRLDRSEMGASMEWELLLIDAIKG